ncbi:MAG TPA: hypothetical protein VJS12_19240 [Steroidobacteraceae bacterium]|nr:hypothetical protein [Steroidobacteraceae bacterium]
MGLVAPLAMLLAVAAQAAPFDEKSQAPRVASSQALRPKLEAHFQAFQHKQQEADPAAFISDRQAYRQWSDLYFAVGLALDERVPLKDLAEFGLVAQANGTYVVDLQKFPQWSPLDGRLYRLNNPAVLQDYEPALRARGFRDSDIAALRTYLATHDPRLALHAKGRELIESFAKRLQSRRPGQPLNLDEALAFRYQKVTLRAETERQWAVALLDALDAQRQRILAAFLFDEFESSLTLGTPVAPLREVLEQDVAPLVSGDYVKMLATEEAEIRREVSQRAEKLKEGELR